MKKFILITIAFFTFSFCGAQKHTLELNLANGVTFGQRMTSDLTMNQEFGGQTMTIKMALSGMMKYKVIDFKNNAYNIEVSYESIGLNMNAQGMEMNFSSENDSDIFGKVLKAMTNKSFNINLDKKGKIVSVKNMDNLFNGLFEQFGELPEEQKVQMKSQLAESFGEDAIKGNLEMALAIFPSSPVAIGDVWNTTTALRSKMPMDIENTFTLKEVTDTYYAISCVSKMKALQDAPAVNVNGMNMKYNLNGTMNADIKIDKKTGWIIDSNYTQDISGTTTVQAGGNIPSDMTIPMKMTNKLFFSAK